MGRHRSPRPRYGRIVAALSALVITAFSVLGGLGLISIAPSAAEGEHLAAAIDPSASRSANPTAELVAQGSGAVAEPTPEVEVEVEDEGLPADSGKGRRIVFSQATQRVWLVRSNGSVRRTYLVSGSLVDNLDQGHYSVFSKSRWAVGVDDSGVMEYFVRFAHGQHAAIGFHTIPTKLGASLQSRADLGTPQSHGCIRQATADAISLWRFAPEGTGVVVV